VTRLLLVRHGLTDAVGTTLAGRAAGWRLNAEGRRQVRRLAEALAETAVHAVYCGPLERALETAAAIAEHRPVSPSVREALDEVDYGDWTGRSFAQLAAMHEWERFNRRRSALRIPAGECLHEVQARIVAEMDGLASRHPGQTVALVSHGDVIKSAIAHTLGMPLDLLMRFEILPASVSVIERREWATTVLAVNIPPEAAGTCLHAFRTGPAAL